MVKTFVDENLIYNLKNASKLHKLQRGQYLESEVDTILDSSSEDNPIYQTNQKVNENILENVSEKSSISSSSSSIEKVIEEVKDSFSEFESVSLTLESNLRQ